MDKQQIIVLHEKYLVGRLTEMELLEWQSILRDAQHEPLLKELMRGTWEELHFRTLTDVSANTATQMFNAIVAPAKVVKMYSPLALWKRIALTAAIVLIAFVTSLYFYNRQEKQVQPAYAADHAPGVNGATLTLAGGKQIDLNKANDGALAAEAGVTITKTADGQLVYSVNNSSAQAGSMNTLSTTLGQTYMVILPDQTKVWLNAASQLRYPASFNGLAKREVDLTGEAYFEVSKTNIPFIVKTATQEIEVLGTHFNVNSYSTEEPVRTTLLEGSVKVTAKAASKETVTLKPGQEASLLASRLRVKDVEATYAVAWKNGYFMFNSESLEEIMERLSRWYQVKVIFEDEQLKRQTFFGTVSRFENISKVLRMLEKTKEVAFEIEENQVKVKSNTPKQPN